MRLNVAFDVFDDFAQAILADDPNHYMALVLMGASLQETDPPKVNIHLHLNVNHSPH